MLPMEHPVSVVNTFTGRLKQGVSMSVSQQNNAKNDVCFDVAGSYQELIVQTEQS